MAEYDEIFHRWNPRINLRNNDGNIITTVEGMSFAGFNTSLYFDRLGIMIDSSIVTRRLPKYIFITHQHGDHIWNIVKQLSNYEDSDKVYIYCPAKIKKILDDYIVLGFRLSTNNDQDLIKTKYQIVPLAEEEKLITLGKASYKLEIFKCKHSVTSYGYGFIEIRTNLKPEYKKMMYDKYGESLDNEFKLLSEDKQNEDEFITIEKKYLHLFMSELMKDCRKNNIPKPDTKSTYENPLFLVCGDTTHDVFDDKRFTKYKYIFVECSFTADDDIKKAKHDKHMHWNHLKEIIKENPTNNFILMHFSRKYKFAEIENIIGPKKYPNVYLFTPKLTMPDFLMSLSKMTPDEILHLIDPIDPFI